MSYDIYLGEPVLVIPNKEDIEEWGDNYIGVRVERMEHPDAPDWPCARRLSKDKKCPYDEMICGGDMSEKSNGRHPGYSQFSEFTKMTGLHDLFFGESGLIGSHPGCSLIQKKDLDQIRAAREMWERAHPDSVPGWCKYKNDDSILARLIWYEWWFDYALKNCKVPAIYNT